MKSTKQNPSWWQLYVTFPLLIGLFMVDNHLKISTRAHQAVQIGIVLLVYGLIHVWLKANARALSRMDRQENSGTFRVIRLPIYQVPNDDEQPLIQIPDSGIKGVLSDTFEMDCIDAKALPVDEAPQK
jgi:hypothetical protein